VVARGRSGARSHAAEQRSDGGKVDLGFAVEDIDLVVLGEATRPPQDGERPFNDPAARCHHGGPLSWLLAHNLDGDPTLLLPAVHEIPAVPAVRPHVRQPPAFLPGCLQHPIGAIPVCDIRRMHDQRDEMALGVNQDVPLGTGYLFPPIEAAVAAGFSRLHTLAVDDPGTRLRVTPHSLSCADTEGVVDTDEGAIECPGVEVVPRGVPIGKVDRQQPPRTAGTVEIEEGIDDLTEIDGRRPSQTPVALHERTDQRPLVVSQISRVAS
jgi:hypothetical protein